jgi:beta-carotene hydroxylase
MTSIKEARMSETEARPRTIAEEIAAGRHNTPDFAWPTVVLFVALFSVAGWAISAALSGRISYVLASAINTVFIYALYTIVHEAIHGNISLKKKRLRWLDLWMGTAACIPLWLFFFPHAKQHMVHHRKANTDEDPDIYARGGFAGWILLRLPLSLINYFNPLQLYRDCRRYGVPQRQVAITYATFAVQTLIVLGLILAGYGRELLVMWFIPWWLGQSVMLTFFTWTPHYDHRETGRYRDTRESLFPGANFLLLGQNHHLIHHMMPGIPFYRYDQTFRDIRPLLEQNNVRIEGLWPGERKGESAE